MTLSTTALQGNRVLVSGEDINGVSGQQILDGSQRAEIKAQLEHRKAHEEFDAAVDEFFADITKAADKVAAAGVSVGDPNEILVVEAPVEGVEARPGKVVLLTHDSQVLRLLDGGQQSRLIWVNGELEILEFVNDQVPSDSELAETLAGPPAEVIDPLG